MYVLVGSFGYTTMDGATAPKRNNIFNLGCEARSYLLFNIIAFKLLVSANFI